MKQLVPRKFERKRFVAEAVIRPLAGEAPMKVDVFDIAEGGLAVFGSRGLPEGQPVEVTFRVTQAAIQAGLEKREGRVVYARVMPEGNHFGIGFVRPLAAAELKLLQASWVRS